MQRIAAPAIVAASGCAPPLPPSPAVGIRFPLQRAAPPPAEPRGEDRLPTQVGGAELLLPRRGERLVRPLQDPLGADVDPRAGGHLAEHRQALRLEPPELLPRPPLRHEQRI